MGYTRFLPGSPETLARWEFNVWLIAALFSVVAIAFGFFARRIGYHRGAILLSRLDEKTREVERLASAAGAKAAALEEQQRPRTLTPEQGIRFKAALAGKFRGSVVLEYSVGDSEAQRFMSQIDALLQDSGWSTHSTARVFDDNLTGVIIAAWKMEKPLLAASVLRAAFAAIGVLADVWAVDREPKSQPVRLIIGHKG
jgi:hypothetical protein